MTLELIKGAALLLSLCMLQSFNVRLWRNHEAVGQITTGLIFGGICLVGMMLPIRMGHGVIFDARSVIVSMAGLFGGPLAGTISAAIAGAYRLYLGGGGAHVGVAVVVASLLLGLGYRYARGRGWVTVGFVPLLLFGVLVHLVSVGLFTQLPAAVVPAVMHKLAVPYVLTFSPATAFLGLLLRDIERRLETEAELRSREHEQSAILNNSPAVIFLKDTEGRMMFGNRQFERLFGVTSDQAIGRTDRELLPPDVADQVIANDRLVLERGEPLEFEETIRIGGQVRTYLVDKFPLRDAGGAIYAVCGIATDITDRSQAEAQRLAALEEARRANQAKSRFLAAMSHDFRTPLNAIMGFSAMLRGPTARALAPEKIEEYAEHIHDSGALMLAMINDILDISAIEAGRHRMTHEPIDLAALARSCIDRMQATARDRDIRMVLDSPDRLPALSADRRAVTQILQNLLSNSLKYSEPGAGITVSLRADGADMRIFVADTGIGIAAEHLATVTEPFSRSHANPHVAQQGTGLGLSIVKSLVEAHDGDLEIESEPGIGTTVAVRLPLAGAT